MHGVLARWVRRLRTALGQVGRPRQARLGGPPTVPIGARVYAIGDIHGRLDLFYDLIERIRIDTGSRARARMRMIVLGDFIDRGPRSMEMAEVLYRLQSQHRNFIVLKGNHEATMLDVLDGDHEALEMWLQHGGRATLASMGIADELMQSDRMRELIAAMQAALPAPLRQWLRTLPTSVRQGDYLFVHAGVRPGVPLKRQTAHDLLWIRDEFLHAEGTHGPVIVHGHSIEEEGPVFRSNRIGIDTGAYRTGRLTALALEGAERWTITT